MALDKVYKLLFNPSIDPSIHQSTSQSASQSVTELVPTTYYAKPADLPAPLPSIEEIHAAEEILKDCSYKVVAIGPFVIKYGETVTVIECENMRFLEKTDIPHPRLYAVFREPETKINYIIMERIIGETVLEAWPTMDDSVKAAVAKKVGAIVNDMRKLKPPGGYCGVGRRWLPFLSDEDESPPDPAHGWKGRPRSLIGPFDTESEFNQALIDHFRAEWNADMVIPKLVGHHPPVFTHGDIQRKNVRIRRTAGTAQNSAKDANLEYDIVLVDWELSAWYG